MLSRNTRAFGRSEIVGHIIKEGWADFLEQTAAHHDPRRPPYVINWSVLQLQDSPVFVMADPFRTYVQESRDYCGKGSSSPSLNSQYLNNDLSSMVVGTGD